MPAESRYLDFDLHLWAEGKDFFAQVSASPIGSSDREKLTWPFGQDSREKLILRLENAILKGHGRGFRGGPISAEEKILRDFGSGMFNAVFRDSKTIGRCFTSSLDHVDADREQYEGLRVKLAIDAPELAALPWEYLFDDSYKGGDPLQSYLCLRSRSPFVRFLEGRTQAYDPIEGPLNVLGMIANPGVADRGGEWENLDVEAERSRIDKVMKPLDPSVVKFQWVKGDTPDHLLAALQQEDWHVFHFIGHGGTDQYPNIDGTFRSEGYLVFANGVGGFTKVSPSNLALMLLNSGNLRLAVLNCCDSARGTSAAEALVKSGLPAVVAMQFPISNDAAVRFSNMFYTSLVAGKSVEKALTAARVSVQMACEVEWGIPVLFTRTGSSVLFKLVPGKTQGREAARVPAPTIVPTAIPTTVLMQNLRFAQAANKQKAREELRRLFEGVVG